MGKPSMHTSAGQEGPPRRATTAEGASTSSASQTAGQNQHGASTQMQKQASEEVPDDVATSMENSPQAQEPTALQERRKALGQIAFVRHSTSELAIQLRAEGSIKQPKVSLNQDHNRFPGSLYNYDQDKQLSRAGTASSLPHIPSTQETPTAYAQSLHEANLNGIGHPVVLRNQRSANGSHPPGELMTPSLGGGHIAQLLQLTPPPPHARHKAKLPLLNLPKASAPDAAAGGADADAEKTRQAMRRLNTLPGPHLHPAQPVVSIAKPLGTDTLNLWRGKRLTRLEMKVEQKLHVVRNNPVAKTDLQSRVHSYIQEKAQEQAERVALAELAAERREQKTLEFVGNRLKAPGKQERAAAAAAAAAATDAPSTSLFDRSTGKPRNDANPLPEGARPFWRGFLALAQKMGQLRDQLAIRAAERKKEAKLLAASLTIQKHWRGFQDRRSYTTLKTGVAPKVRLHVTPAMREQAVKKVLAFLEYSHGAAVLAYLRKRFREKNSAEALGTVASAFWSAESIRSFRVSIIVSQWQAVESRCIDLAKKRMRSNIIGELPAPPRVSMSGGSALAPLLAEKRRQGSRSGMDDADTVRQAVTDALSKTFVNDRVVLEDLRPVPKPVKMAALQIYMQNRLQAYIAQLGVYWKRRAKYMGLARTATAKAMAVSAMQEAFGAQESNAEAQAQQAAELGDPGPFPRYRSLATLPELKALMQQGVAETPFFRSYMMRQKLQAYENELTQELADRFAEEDEEMLKEIAKRGKASKVKAAREPAKKEKEPQRPAEGGALPRAKSFTLALLLHRWHTECNPRMQACLAKRLQLLGINLVACLFSGKWMNHDDMGSKLMELRDG